MLLIDLWALFQQYQALFLALKIDGIQETLQRLRKFRENDVAWNFLQISHWGFLIVQFF